MAVVFAVPAKRKQQEANTCSPLHVWAVCPTAHPSPQGQWLEAHFLSPWDRVVLLQHKKPFWKGCRNEGGDRHCLLQCWLRVSVDREQVIQLLPEQLSVRSAGDWNLRRTCRSLIPVGVAVSDLDKNPVSAWFPCSLLYAQLSCPQAWEPAQTALRRRCPL